MVIAQSGCLKRSLLLKNGSECEGKRSKQSQENRHQPLARVALDSAV